jgi:SPP1 gp7 family putative phage head morphogenesis protein
MADLSKVNAATSSLERDFIKVLTSEYKIALDDIRAKISAVYDRYGVDGKLDIATMQKMAIKDQKEITRLNKLFAQIDEDLAHLNRGKPQQIASYLTDVYQTNYDGVGNVIGTKTGASFDVINRQAIYQNAFSDLSKISLQANADAIKFNIRRSITAGITQGEGIRDMSKRIATDLGTNANNAVRIARTETTRVMGEARQSVFEQTQAQGIRIQKRWLSATDDRTRSSHERLDGVTIDVDQTFPNGLMYPGDQSGPPEEVINCRCTMITILPDFE